MVRQATETAVSASISTPVCPVTFAVARTISPGKASSGSMSTAILESASGWQSGMSSCVFLPAMMPAMRAAPSTSPFLASPLSTRSSVEAVITTRPSAIATRSVAAFADTSTMRASPLLPRWVSLPSRATGLLRCACEPRRPAEEGTRRSRDVALAHQALANEKCPHADGRKIIKSSGAEDPAFRHRDTRGGNSRREPLSGRKRGLERAQIAIVDTEETRAQLERALELDLVVHLEQHIHAIGDGGCLKLLRERVGHARHDDQDAVGAPGARLRHLISIVHEILAQRRQFGRGARGGEILGFALDRGRVGEHREAGRAACRISARERRRIEVGANEAFRWACLLDLGDQSVATGRVLFFQRANEAARRRQHLGVSLERREGARALGGRNLRALIGLDLGKDVRHRASRIRDRDQAVEPTFGFA